MRVNPYQFLATYNLVQTTNGYPSAGRPRSTFRAS